MVVSLVSGKMKTHTCYSGSHSASFWGVKIEEFKKSPKEIEAY